MGKSDEKLAKKRAHKATAGGEGKHKNKPSVDTIRSSPFETTFEAIDNDEGLRHSKWRDFFQRLCEYKAQFGHCLVPQQYAANPVLGKWVSTQRTRYKKNTGENSTSMTSEHIRALDGIGFDWGTNKTGLASIWIIRFEQLREYKVQFSHCFVPHKYDANPMLGKWVSTQRSNYRMYHQEGKRSPMTEERIRALESVGFDWESDRNELTSMWGERFEQLREFKVQFGHCLVPRRYAANIKLGQWVATQRSNYRFYQEGKPHLMTTERIRALQHVGFVWDAKSLVWNAFFEQLLEFKVQFGHYVVPQRYAANITLGRWVKKQRSSYKLYQEGKPSPMTAEHIRELERVEFK